MPRQEKRPPPRSGRARAIQSIMIWNLHVCVTSRHNTRSQRTLVHQHTRPSHAQAQPECLAHTLPGNIQQQNYPKASGRARKRNGSHGSNMFQSPPSGDGRRIGISVTADATLEANFDFLCLAPNPQPNTDGTARGQNLQGPQLQTNSNTFSPMPIIFRNLLVFICFHPISLNYPEWVPAEWTR